MTIVSCFVVNSGGFSIVTPLYMVGPVKDNYSMVPNKRGVQITVLVGTNLEI